MAELSADTLAILDRLKKEGSYIRNGSGGGERNSLKQVKIELQKFGATFEAIRESMGGVQAITTQQAEFDKLRAAEEAEIAKLAKEDQDEYRKQQAENVKRNQKLETDKLKQEEKKRKEDSKRELKLFGKDGIVTSAIKSSFSFLKTVAIFGALGAVGYEFIAGMLEAAFPKTFGEGGTVGKLPTTFEIFGKVGDIFTSVDWEGFKKNISFLASSEFYASIAAIAGTAAVGAVAAKGISTGATLLTGASLANLFTPGKDDVDKAGNKPGKFGTARKLAIRGGIAGAIFMAAEAVMPIFEKGLMFATTDMKAEDIMKVEPTPMQKAPGNLGTASMAALFAPGGPFVKAVVGVGTFAILSVMDYLEDRKDAGVYTNAVEEVLRNESNEVARQERKLQLLKDQAKGLDEQALKLSGLDKEIAKQQELVDKLKVEEKEAAMGALAEAVKKKRDLEKIPSEEEQAKAFGKYDAAREAAAKAEFGPHVNRYRSKAARAKYGFSEEDLNSEALLNYLDPDRQENLETIGKQIAATFKRFPELAQDENFMKALQQFRGGTKGFTNFGSGTLAILHGEEAIVPRGSLEGQILEGLRSGMLPTKDNMTGLIAKAMQSGGMGGVTNIINNVDNSAPISIQQSKGGDKISNSRFMGGAGGGSYVDMPGLVS